jgi:hypothetical protein
MHAEDFLCRADQSSTNGADMKRRESIYLFLPFSVLIFIGECLLPTLPLTIALLQHVGLLLACGCFLGVLHWFSFDVRLVVCLILFTLFLGPFGAGVGLAMGGFYLVYRRFSSPLSAILEQLFPEEQPEHAIVTVALRIERGFENVDVDTTALPLLDIMMFGSLAQRSRAMRIILRHFHPKLSPMLQLGLRDPNNSIRVLAATSLLALEKRFHEEYLALESEAHKNPTSPHPWLALAKQTDKYANSHLLFSERKIKMLTLSRQAYATYASLAGMNDEVRLAIARADLQLGEVDQAVEALTALPTCDATAIKLLAEAAFRKSDYAGLRAIAQRASTPLTGNEMDGEIVTHFALLWKAGTPAYV